MVPKQWKIAIFFNESDFNVFLTSSCVYVWRQPKKNSLQISILYISYSISYMEVNDWNGYILEIHWSYSYTK